MRQNGKKQKRTPEKNKGEGSVWTSYSDLFMAIAVVFLILFVFSILQSGVSQINVSMERKAQEEILTAMAPADVREKNKSGMKAVEADINDVEEKQKDLQKTLQKLAKLTESLENRKTSLKDLYDENIQKSGRIELAAKEVQKKNEKIENLEKQLEQLMKNKNKSNENFEELQKKLEKQEKQKNDMIKEIDEKQAAFESLKKQLEDEKINQKLTLEELKKKELAVVNEQKKQQIESENEIKRLKQSMQSIEQQVYEKEIALEEKEKTLSKEINRKDELKSELEQMKKLIKEKNVVEKNQNMQNTELVAKIEQLQKKQTQQIDSNVELKKNNEDLGKKIKELQLNSSKLQNNYQTASSESTTLKEKIFKLEASIEALKGNLNEQKKLNSEQKMQKSAADKQIKDLESKISKKSEELKELNTSGEILKQKLANLEKELQAAGREAGDLKGSLEQMTKENGKLKGDVGKLQGSHDQLQKANDGLKVTIASLQSGNKQCLSEKDDITKKNNNCEKQIVMFEKEAGRDAENIEKLKGVLSQLNNQKIHSDRKISDIARTVNDFDKKRKDIAHKLIESLKNSGIDVEIDKNTGKLTFHMDEIFYFKNNSAELSDTAKQKMKSVFPVYAKTLFGNEKISKQIKFITVTGFASPVYKGRYVDPTEENLEAFDYNLELSFGRARSISNYILGDEIGNYDFKSQLIKKSRVSGSSFANAIPIQEGDELKPEDKKCGIYHCTKSRRVEINFILNDRNDLLKEFEVIKSKINAK